MSRPKYRSIHLSEFAATEIEGLQQLMGLSSPDKVVIFLVGYYKGTARMTITQRQAP